MRFKHITTLLLGFIPLIVGLSGCEREIVTPEEPVPFVRLLKNETFQSNILHRSMNFAVLLPAEYEDTTRSFPVVFLLHGMGDNQTAWYQWGNINSYVDANAAETIPMIYVMPQGFNTYWVNKYNGNYPYMDVITNEMVPTIDSMFRTIPEAQHRAVMGYSMGGYGALILPAKNPDLFSTSVVLSMSYRTDQQYMDEPQEYFDSQWGSVFGGIGASGTARLTDYYKIYNPFYFFARPGDISLNGQHYYFDCGDDEENLSEPNDQLHGMLRDLNIPHEYRMKNGAHNWDYWHKALPEALKYISQMVQGIPYADNPPTIDPGPAIPANRIIDNQDESTGINYRVVLPSSYSGGTDHYAVIVVLHDLNPELQEEESQQMISLLNTGMDSGMLPGAIIVEIPLQSAVVSETVIRDILTQVRSIYRTTEDRNHALLIGNSNGGLKAYELMPACADLFNACMLFDAGLPENAIGDTQDISYYLDICDEGINYKSYHALYMNLRQSQIPHEYRVRQGTPSHDSFLHGLSESTGFMKDHLRN